MPPVRYQHRFAESEASLILQRAADLQRQASDARRMTVGELEDAAASAGIDPIHVRRAAAELCLRQARRDRFSPVIGGPRTILIEVASLIGRSLTWTALPGHSRAGPGWSRTIAVTIVPRAGRTRIRIEEKLDQLVRNVFGTSLIGVGGTSSLIPIISLAVFGLPGLIPIGVGLWMSGSWSLARRTYRERVAARERELHGALQAIMDIAEDYLAQRRLRSG
jgi:hypothetical protein